MRFCSFLVQRSLLRAALACLVLVASGIPGWCYDPDTPRFILSTFRNADQTKLYIATSFDGRNYAPLGGTHVYEVTDGTILRDPSMIFYRGQWFICHTSGTGLGFANYFRILVSDDLVNWTLLAQVSLAAIPNTRYVWAPEWFVDDDDSVHILVSASFWWTNEHSMYEIHPVTPGDFTAWSAPQRLHGPAFPEFATTPEPGPAERVGAYDPYVIKKDGVYHLWYFNRPTSSLAHATAPALTGPYTATITNNLYGTGTWKEGQTMQHFGGSRWRFTYANAITSTLYFIESSDDWQTWTAPQLIGSPDGIVFNHGTVVTNPHLPRFEMKIDPPTTGGLVSIEFPTIKQNGYQLEWSDDLVVWNDLGEPVEGTGLPLAFESELPESGNIFFRAKWLPFWTAQ